MLQEASGELFGTHSDATLEPNLTPKPCPEGLQTAARRFVERYPAALQNRGLAKLRWAGRWRACAC